MPRLDRHPDINWPPVFGGSYAGAQPLMTDLDGTLVRVEHVPAVVPAPLQIRLVAMYKGCEFSGILECPKPRLFAELRSRFSQCIGRPVRDLGEIEFPADPMWQVKVEGACPTNWPNDNTAFQLRSEHRIFVKRSDEDNGWVVATANIDAPSATEATRTVYWKLRKVGMIAEGTSGFYSGTATDADGNPAEVVMEAVVQRPDREES